MKNYLYYNAIAFDQLFNALLGGFCDETFSSRVFRHSENKGKPKYWRLLRCIIDNIFFWQKVKNGNNILRHCELSYIAEFDRKHFPIWGE